MNSKIKNLTTEFTKHTEEKEIVGLKLRVLCALRVFFFLLLFCLLVSCSGQKLPVQEIQFEKEGRVIASVKAEIARTDDERNKGLMYRKKLSDGEGMLFVYEKDEILSFWMKNTFVPLSIAFITSDGRIANIKDMYPHDLKSVTSERSVRYALEAPQGWFTRTGVEIGDVARIEKINYNR
jgi:uncharacterized membrane protein (UPF0127 family)